ncbi:hypothetical protein N8077_04315 [Myxococcota bacterium]|nr:hypothetical protein [Myxococcota bacterium]
MSQGVLKGIGYTIDFADDAQALLSGTQIIDESLGDLVDGLYEPKTVASEVLGVGAQLVVPGGAVSKGGRAMTKALPLLAKGDNILDATRLGRAAKGGLLGGTADAIGSGRELGTMGDALAGSDNEILDAVGSLTAVEEDDSDWEVRGKQLAEGTLLGATVTGALEPVAKKLMKMKAARAVKGVADIHVDTPVAADAVESVVADAAEDVANKVANQQAAHAIIEELTGAVSQGDPVLIAAIQGSKKAGAKASPEVVELTASYTAKAEALGLDPTTGAEKLMMDDYHQGLKASFDEIALDNPELRGFLDDFFGNGADKDGLLDTLMTKTDADVDASLAKWEQHQLSEDWGTLDAKRADELQKLVSDLNVDDSVPGLKALDERVAAAKLSRAEKGLGTPEVPVRTRHLGDRVALNEEAGKAFEAALKTGDVKGVADGLASGDNIAQVLKTEDGVQDLVVTLEDSFLAAKQAEPLSPGQVSLESEEIIQGLRGQGQSTDDIGQALEAAGGNAVVDSKFLALRSVKYGAARAYTKAWRNAEALGTLGNRSVKKELARLHAGVGALDTAETQFKSQLGLDPTPIRSAEGVTDGTMSLIDELATGKNAANHARLAEALDNAMDAGDYLKVDQAIKLMGRLNQNKLTGAIGVSVNNMLFGIQTNVVNAASILVEPLFYNGEMYNRAAAHLLTGSLKKSRAAFSDANYAMGLYLRGIVQMNPESAALRKRAGKAFNENRSQLDSSIFAEAGSAIRQGDVGPLTGRWSGTGKTAANVKDDLVAGIYQRDRDTVITGLMETANLTQGASTRALVAMDEWGKGLNYSIHSRIAARRHLSRSQPDLEGHELHNAIERLSEESPMWEALPDGPQKDLHRQIYEESIEIARLNTFQSDLDWAKQGIGEHSKDWGQGEKSMSASFADFRSTNPALQVIVPFHRTPTNMFRKGAERFPGIGLLARRNRDDWYSGDPDRRAAAAARQMLGAEIFTLVGGLFGAGNLTGNIVNRDLGEEPMSFRVNGNWYSYRRLNEPVAIMLSATIDAMSLLQDSKSDDLDVDVDIVGGIATVMGDLAMSQPGVSGPRDLLRSWSNGTIVETLVDRGADFVPILPGVSRNLKNPYLFEGDPELEGALREVRGVQDILMSKVPGLQGQLAVKRNFWGEPINSRPGYGSDSWDDLIPGKIINSITAQAGGMIKTRPELDQVTQELKDIGFEPNLTQRTKRYQGSLLTAEQSNRVKELMNDPALSPRGESMRDEIERKMTHRMWTDEVDGWTDTQKRDKINKIYSKRLGKAFVLLENEYEELTEAVLDKQRNKKPTAERQKLYEEKRPMFRERRRSSVQRKGDRFSRNQTREDLEEALTK